MPNSTERRHPGDEESLARWGDPALRNLEHWLVEHDVDESRAAFLAESVWLFHSYILLPTVSPDTRSPLPIGIAAKNGRSRRDIRLFVPALVALAHRNIGGDGLHELSDAFREKVADRLDSNPAVRLEFPRDTFHEGFEATIRRRCEREGFTYLGTFTDDLREELKTIIQPDQVGQWLDTPNTRFGGRKPKDLLNTPDDELIRNMIVSARHGMAA